MKARIAMVAMALLIGLSTASVSAQAHTGGNFLHNLFHWLGGSHGGSTQGGSTQGGSTQGSGRSVPELDTAAGPLALALIGGVVAIGLERRRRKNKQNQQEDS